jgi:curved DNA-binding protein CbpA
VPSRDPHDVLGVPRDASVDEIKAVYRQLARTFHPDVNAHEDAVEHFREITEAFLALSDPRARRPIDRPRSRRIVGEETQMTIGLRVAGLSLGGLLGVEVSVSRRPLFADPDEADPPPAALRARNR